MYYLSRDKFFIYDFTSTFKIAKYYYTKFFFV